MDIGATGGIFLGKDIISVHKFTIDHEVGPAVFVRCIKCKRQAFYLKYKVFAINSEREFAPVIHIMSKLQQTMEYLKCITLSGPFSTAYFDKSDIIRTKLMIRYNCEEMDVKDILE